MTAATEPSPLERAWALKNECYAAWSSQPAHAERCADALRELAAQAPDEPRIAALAAWTGGIAHITRGEMAEAVETLAEAERRLARCGEALAAAQTLVPRIIALAMLGRHAESVACAEQAQQRLLALGDTPGAAKVSLNLAALLIRRSEPVPAAGHARRAAVLFARERDHEHSVMADISLADALAMQGDFDEAQRIYARAGMRARTHALPVLQALVDESTALLELIRGRYAQALAGLESSRRHYEQLAMPQHLATAEKQLADAYLQLNLLPEALALYDTALERFEALAMPDERAATLQQRALALARSGRHEAADRSLQQSASLYASLEHQSGSAAVALARAELALAADAEPGAARQLAAQALRLLAEASQPARLAAAEIALAEAELRSGAVARAGALFSQALERAQPLQLLPLALRARTGQGRVALAEGRLDNARSAFTEAIDQQETLGRALPGDDLRRAWATEQLRPYHELVRLRLADRDAAAAADILRLLERYRARTASPWQPLADRSGDDEGLSRLRERLNWLYHHIQRLEDEGTPTPAAWTEEARQTEASLLEAARRQRLDQAGSDEDRRDPVSLCDSLSPGQALVLYAVADDELFAIVMRHDGVQLVRALASWSRVLEACRAWRNQMDTLGSGAAHLERHLAQLTARANGCLQRLHALVWAPLASWLSGCDQVLVAAHADLAELPFAAVRSGGRGPVQEQRLAMVASARQALHLLERERSMPAQGLLVMADSQRLQHALGEAQAVAAAHGEGLVYSAEQASIATLEAQGPHAALWHLACHARYRADNPYFSALQLADGPYSVERIASLALRARLIVLSACEAGAAQRSAADDAVGLVGALLGAGAQRVVAANWPVDDRFAADFMVGFHRRLAAGAGVASALARTQAAMAQAHPHPHRWAAFGLHGLW